MGSCSGNVQGWTTWEPEWEVLVQGPGLPGAYYLAVAVAVLAVLAVR